MQKELAIKITIVFVVAFLILVPIGLVKSKVYERQSYQLEAYDSVARSWTGKQSLLSPVLVLPYKVKSVNQQGFNTNTTVLLEEKFAFVMPETLSAQVRVKNRNLLKGIYKIPVYQSTIQLEGEYLKKEIERVSKALSSQESFAGWGNPYLGVPISDVRGVEKLPAIKVNGSRVSVESGSGIRNLMPGLRAVLPAAFVPEAFLSADMDSIQFEATIDLKGMESINVIPMANDAKLVMTSDWPHPNFAGDMLPVKRKIDSTGFEAEWHSSRFSNNYPAELKECTLSSGCGPLMQGGASVKFIDPVDIYLQSERTIKYAVLFVGLSFISFFLFECMRKIKIHPIQYAFVGLAISVFYLLLLSLSEHITFALAYAVAAMSCCSLLLFYMKHVLRSVFTASFFVAMMAVLYSVLYVIVQSEDFAFLMGALLVFCSLSALMIVTRDMDWYQLVRTKVEVE